MSLLWSHSHMHILSLNHPLGGKWELEAIECHFNRLKGIKDAFSTPDIIHYDAQIWHGHAMGMTGTRIVHIKSEVMDMIDTILYFAYFKVPGHHRSFNFQSIDCNNALYIIHVGW